MFKSGSTGEQAELWSLSRDSFRGKSSTFSPFFWQSLLFFRLVLGYEQTGVSFVFPLQLGKKIQSSGKQTFGINFVQKLQRDFSSLPQREIGRQKLFPKFDFFFAKGKYYIKLVHIPKTGLFAAFAASEMNFKVQEFRTCVNVRVNL